MSARQYQLADVSFTRVADLFLTELRTGANPSIEKYATAFPHLDAEIRADFPTMRMLECTVGTIKNREPSPPNAVLGGCEIMEEIGRGAMGIVYKGYQPELDRQVAVKVIPIQGTDSERLIERFELERRAMARLDHPNIVPVYSYGHDSKHAFLVMKLIDGKSLFQLLDGETDYRSQVFFSSLQDDWRELAKLGAEVASGLQHAHDQGLIHRDVKPANLLLDRHGKVWVTDFGLAKIYDYARSLSRTGEAIGTPRYMAPEQLRGICDPRSDVYSLGITLYELAAKERAWDKQTLSSLTVERASLELPDIREKNKNVPDHLARIIMKACAFSPEDRYHTTKEMQMVLERFVAGITPSDRRRRKRLPDAIFRKQSRRTIMATLTAMPFLIMGSSFLINQYKIEQKRQSAASAPEASPVSRKSATNFIEQLADAKDADLGKVVSEYIRESVVESGDEFHLAEDEKDQIVSQVDQVVAKLRKKNPHAEAERSFIENYQDSTLPLASKIISLVRVVDKSGLSQQEKNAGHENLRRYAKAVVNHHVSFDEAQRTMSGLTNGKLYATAELDSITIADRNIRLWLVSLQRRIESLPPQAYNELNITEELERSFEQAMKAAESRPRAEAARGQ